MEKGLRPRPAVENCINVALWIAHQWFNGEKMEAVLLAFAFAEALFFERAEWNLEKQVETEAQRKQFHDQIVDLITRYSDPDLPF